MAENPSAIAISVFMNMQKEGIQSHTTVGN